VEVYDAAAKEANLYGQTAGDLDPHIKRADGKNHCVNKVEGSDLISISEDQDEEADNEP
jgi:hypothetical protein